MLMLVTALECCPYFRCFQVLHPGVEEDIDRGESHSIQAGVSLSESRLANGKARILFPRHRRGILGSNIPSYRQQWRIREPVLELSGEDFECSRVLSCTWHSVPDCKRGGGNLGFEVGVSSVAILSSKRLTRSSARVRGIQSRMIGWEPVYGVEDFFESIRFELRIAASENR